MSESANFALGVGQIMSNASLIHGGETRIPEEADGGWLNHSENFGRTCCFLSFWNKVVLPVADPGRD